MKRVTRTIAGTMTLLASLATGTAHAGPLSNGAIFSDFNAVLFGSFTTSWEVEGRTVVGGNLTANNSVNFEIKTGLSVIAGFGALSVYGNVNGSGSTLNI